MPAECIVRSEAAIQNEFGIAERTVLRWVAACCREVVDPSGQPMIEAVGRGDRGMLQTARWPVDLTTLPAA